MGVMDTYSGRLYGIPERSCSGNVPTFPQDRAERTLWIPG